MREIDKNKHTVIRYYYLTYTGYGSEEIQYPVDIAKIEDVVGEEFNGFIWNIIPDAMDIIREKSGFRDMNITSILPELPNNEHNIYYQKQIPAHVMSNIPPESRFDIKELLARIGMKCYNAMEYAMRVGHMFRGDIKIRSVYNDKYFGEDGRYLKERWLTAEQKESYKKPVIKIMTKDGEKELKYSY